VVGIPDSLPGKTAEVGTLCDVNAVPTVPAPGNRAFTYGAHTFTLGVKLSLYAPTHTC
jgi:hypothetical protein